MNEASGSHYRFHRPGFQVSSSGDVYVQNAASVSGKGVLNIGSGGFAGGAGNYTGSSTGTQLAINASSGFTGYLFDAEVNGVSRFLIDHSGQLLVNTPSGYSGNLINLWTNGTVELSVDQSGSLTFNGHLIAGQSNGVTSGAGGGLCGAGASVSATGNDERGTITITTGATAGSCATGGAIQVNFISGFAATPFVYLTPTSTKDSGVNAFIGSTTTSFFLVTFGTAPAINTTYTWNYIVIQ